MNCPRCGRPMEEGTLHTHKYPFWTQQALRMFRGPSDQVTIGPVGEDAPSVFLRDPFLALPGAMLCRSCGMVCFPGTLMEKPDNKT